LLEGSKVQATGRCWKTGKNGAPQVKKILADTSGGKKNLGLYGGSDKLQRKTLFWACNGTNGKVGGKIWGRVV